MLWNQIHRFREFGSLLFCVSFSLTSLIWNGNNSLSFIYKINNLNSFFISTLNEVGNFVREVFRSVQTKETLRKERDSYQKIVEEYKTLPYDLEVLRRENEALRKELGFHYSSQYPTIKAEVLLLRLNSLYRTMIISKGKKEGIKPLMPVIAQAVTEEGEVLPAIVGKVIFVEENTSLVQPIINSSFNMGVLIPQTNFWAILSGNSGRSTLAVLNYVDASVIINSHYSSKLSIGPEQFFYEKTYRGVLGMLVYSSGEGLFPPNIPVGKIVEEGPRSGYFKTAYVEPLVNFTELKYVTVIKKEPERWRDIWPEEQNLLIESPFYGELDFPEEEQLKTTNTKLEEKKKEIPKKTEIAKIQETKNKQEQKVKEPLNKKEAKTPVEEDAEFLIQKIQGEEN